MPTPGKDAGAKRSVDPDLAKALSHPLRQQILEQLNVKGETSPKQLAALLDASLNTVAYHVGVLRRLGCIELARTRQVRGALEHYYRALIHPWLDAEQWGKLPASFRRQVVASTLRDIFADASEAGGAGGFDDPDAQIRRTVAELDEQGWREVSALLEETSVSLEQIRGDCARRAAGDPGDRPSIDAEIALLLFRRG